jgi:hypothetical protein
MYSTNTTKTGGLLGCCGHENKGLTQVLRPLKQGVYSGVPDTKTGFTQVLRTLKQEVYSGAPDG